MLPTPRGPRLGTQEAGLNRHRANAGDVRLRKWGIFSERRAAMGVFLADSRESPDLPLTDFGRRRYGHPRRRYLLGRRQPPRRDRRKTRVEPESASRPELGPNAEPQRIAEPAPNVAPPRPRLVSQGGRLSGRDLVAQICDGDPLELGPAAVAEVNRRAVLVEPGHVSSKAAARAAFELARDGRLESAVERVDGWTKQALVDELDDQRSGSASGIPQMPGEFLLRIGERLGIEPGLIVDASNAFNRLPAVVRRVFFETVINGRSFRELERAGLGDDPTLERRLRCALETISHLRLADVHPADLDGPMKDPREGGDRHD